MRKKNLAYGRTGYWFSHPVAGVPHDMTDAQLEPVELLVDDAQADDETEQGRFVLSRSAARFAACWAFSASSRAVWNDSAKNSYTQRNTRTECGCQKKIPNLFGYLRLLASEVIQPNASVYMYLGPVVE